MDKLKRLFEEHQKEQNKYQSKNDNVMIVDGTNTFFRCFGANPALNDEGYHVGGMLGFLYSIGVGIRLTLPTRLVIVFDGRGGSKRRKKIFEGYKQGRAMKSTLRRSEGFSDLEDPEESMKRQFERLLDYLSCLPITLITIDNIEADDVIAYSAKQYLDKEVVIFSSDKDFLQLIDERINVYLPTKKKLYTLSNFQEDYWVSSKNYIHRKCIEGDKSDGIPGIKGIGIKTIQKKLPFLTNDKFYDLDEFYDKVKKLNTDNDRIYNKLINKKSDYERNYKLMQLHNVDISGNFKSNIRNIYEQDIEQLQSVEFFNLCKLDNVSSAFKQPLNWLNTNFSRLDMYRNK